MFFHWHKYVKCKYVYGYNLNVPKRAAGVTADLVQLRDRTVR